MSIYMHQNIIANSSYVKTNLPPNLILIQLLLFLFKPLIEHNMLYKPTCLLCVHTRANRAQWMTLFHESHIHWLSGHSGEMGWAVDRWVGSGFWGASLWVKYIEGFVWTPREVCPEWFHFSSACKLDMQPAWTLFKTSIMEAAALLCGQRVVGACHGGSQRTKGGADWRLKLGWRGLGREQLVGE